MNKLMLAAMIGVAAQMTLAADAHADGFKATSLQVYAADPLDVAPVKNGRLQKKRYEESQEQAVVTMLDKTNGIYVQMQSGSLKDASGATVQPVHRQQLACTPFKLTAGADGTVTPVASGPSKFITDNVGQDYRNANFPRLFTVNGGKNAVVTFNYRPQGANNTNRYAKVIDASCNLLPVQNAAGQTQKQVVIMQKNNDDCDQGQSSSTGTVYSDDATAGTNIAYWAGCNGNGKDDGWVNSFNVKPVNGGAAFQISKNFDVDVEPQEERTRGACDISAADPTTAVCTWSAGNNQPTRDGTWIGAIDLSAAGAKGENANSRLLWKKLLQKDTVVAGVRTYSVRANSARVLTPDANGNLVKGNQIFVQTSLLRGNNTNNRKGGRYLAMYLGVANATRTGLTWDIPLTDVTNQMLGIDATHLVEQSAVFQDVAKNAMVPVYTMGVGSHNGGAANMDVKLLVPDFTAKKFVDEGTFSAGAPYDRHLYSNYLGGNPGNQGRNFAGAMTLANPFYTAGSTAAPFLLMHALTGKNSANIAKPEIKGDGFISLMALQKPAAAPPAPPAGMPNTQQVGSNGANYNGGGQNAQPQAGDPTPANDPSMMAGTPSTPGSFSSGCSMSSGAEASASGVFFLLLGVAFVTLARRRRA